MAANYTEASIKTLSSLEHIRLRPGMYIGQLGNGAHADDGIYVLLKETIDNSIDEFMMGQGKKIEVEITERTRAGARLRPRHSARASWSTASRSSTPAPSTTARRSRNPWASTASGTRR